MCLPGRLVAQVGEPMFVPVTPFLHTERVLDTDKHQKFDSKGLRGTSVDPTVLPLISPDLVSLRRRVGNHFIELRWLVYPIPNWKVSHSQFILVRTF